MALTLICSIKGYNLICFLFTITSLTILSVIFLFSACNPKERISDPGAITLSEGFADFSEVGINSASVPQSLTITGSGVKSDIDVTVKGDFEISLGDSIFLKKIVLPASSVNNTTIILVRCFPQSTGKLTGTLLIESDHITPKIIELAATGIKVLKSITTFNKVRHAFGGGFSQSATSNFSFPVKPEYVETINMFIKLSCPTGGCNAWDVYSNIKVKDSVSGKWFEIGRYITPYGVDNSQVAKGFKIDVTDFKSLLTGNVSLKSFIEVWGSDGWLLTVNFEITEGLPDYRYYSVNEIIQYNSNSLEGIPYGEPNKFVVEKNITIPANTEKTTLRTIITGWGHATPADPDGRPCAEWCFRTNKILINGVPRFTHQMSGCGCGSNAVHPQNGNWAPDRAGWCPGMEVPVRSDIFESTMAGTSFTYKYQIPEWSNDFKSSADNKHAYHAISSFVVIKSNSPFTRPAVVN